MEARLTPEDIAAARAGVADWVSGNDGIPPTKRAGSSFYYLLRACEEVERLNALLSVRNGATTDRPARLIESTTLDTNKHSKGDGNG